MIQPGLSRRDGGDVDVFSPRQPQRDSSVPAGFSTARFNNQRRHSSPTFVPPHGLHTSSRLSMPPRVQAPPGLAAHSEPPPPSGPPAAQRLHFQGPRAYQQSPALNASDNMKDLLGLDFNTSKRSDSMSPEAATNTGSYPSIGAVQEATSMPKGPSAIVTIHPEQPQRRERDASLLSSNYATRKPGMFAPRPSSPHRRLFDPEFTPTTVDSVERETKGPTVPERDAGDSVLIKFD